jgi:ATP-binding cassette subfamily B protein
MSSVSSKHNSEGTETHKVGGLDQKMPLSGLSRLISEVRPQVAFLSLLTLVSGALEAAFLVVVARSGIAVADGESRIVVLSSFDVSVNQSLLIALSLIISRLIAALWSVQVTMNLTYRISTNLRSRLSHSFLRSSWAIQQAQPAGVLQQLVVTFPNQGASLITGLANALGAALTLLAMLAISFSVDPVSTLAVLMILLVLGLILRPLRNRVNNRSEASIDPQVAFSNGVAQVGSLGLEIQAFGVQDQTEEYLDKLIQVDAIAQRRVGLMSYSVSPIYITLAYGAVLFALAIVASLDTKNLGSSGAVMLIMLRTLSYGQSLQQGAVTLAQIGPFLNLMEATIIKYETNRATVGSQSISHVGSIKAKNLTFSYTENRPALQDVSFQLEKGKSYGVIGPSGSGKSTLVQLLLGLREPISGQLLINDIDLQDIDRASWSSRVSFVPQDASLITGTVAQNIVFFRSGISEAQMMDAAKAAHVFDDIQKLPKGFDTDLGERAQQLSGGQRQRLSIARALVGNPELLILDEPTSALDMKSESVIRETIESLNGKVTILVIAHRLSTLNACSKLMVIQNGKLVAFATPEELACDNDFYKEALKLANVR